MLTSGAPSSTHVGAWSLLFSFQVLTLPLEYANSTRQENMTTKDDLISTISSEAHHLSTSMFSATDNVFTQTLSHKLSILGSIVVRNVSSLTLSVRQRASH
ncbi:hypothetical protein AUEXF2481DRAFT_39037 [Aureobasidium subglaciale EXF-2481]|uniref:Uncharacterized protein n=1 Tax=Aureobasidium subglaciale (strain EXF-2481) TaxID=1043005 RepID=A0A074ZB33_AURSE|nr:uncharacterized protein AUEXF2481DRAFT_39037 [Aureobasidium subglaciale EXF-2481]KEQ95961.1 hypothetical protein AUEXF2481DRAFT_39037 [Aureobasidium subglaciale EXF-2481]